jgi:hypothetical protein
MPHELGVSFHSQFALNAAWHNDSAAALCDGWRVVHECIKLMPLEFGSNSGDDVVARAHKRSLSYSLYLRHV